MSKRIFSGYTGFLSYNARMCFLICNFISPYKKLLTSKLSNLFSVARKNCLLFANFHSSRRFSNANYFPSLHFYVFTFYVFTTMSSTNQRAPLFNHSQSASACINVTFIYKYQDFCSLISFYCRGIFYECQTKTFKSIKQFLQGYMFSILKALLK